jgi:nicotinate-nucleotide adenylyltransferase
MELDRPGPSFTADTLGELHERSPDDELFLILGGDQAAALPDWHEPERVLALATPVVFERSGGRREQVEQRLSGLAGGDRVQFLEMPLLEVSSTLIRSRAAAGRPIRYFVPDKVASFIGAQSLYGASVPAS